MSGGVFCASVHCTLSTYWGPGRILDVTTRARFQKCKQNDLSWESSRGRNVNRGYLRDNNMPGTAAGAEVNQFSGRVTLLPCATPGGRGGGQNREWMCTTWGWEPLALSGSEAATVPALRLLSSSSCSSCFSFPPPPNPPPPPAFPPLAYPSPASPPPPPPAFATAWVLSCTMHSVSQL